MLEITFTIQASTYGEAVKQSQDIVSNFLLSKIDFVADSMDYAVSPGIEIIKDDGSPQVLEWAVDVIYRSK